MRVLIASNDPSLMGQARAVLERYGRGRPTVCAVPLEAAADGAAQVHPELVCLIQRTDMDLDLESLREIRSTFPAAHVLVAGPTGNSKAILETLKTGADAYLDLDNLDTELTSSLIRLKIRDERPPATFHSGRIIAVVGVCGGCGASTVAANLSVLLAQQYGDSGLLDLRPGTGDLASLLDVQPVHSLADFCERSARADHSMFDQVLARHASGVHLLAAPTRFSDLRRVTSRGIRCALAMARGRFPYVLVDVGVLQSAEQLEALSQAESILLVLRLDFAAIRNARQALDALAGLGIGQERLRLVVNGYRQPRQLQASQAETALGKKISHYVPYAPAAVNEAMNLGIPVVLRHRHARVTRSLRELARSVHEVSPQPTRGVVRERPAQTIWAKMAGLLALLG